MMALYSYPIAAMNTRVTTLPFLSEVSPELDSDTPRWPVCVYRYDYNACERERCSKCDTVAGLYYGSDDEYAGKLCPRHFYEDHFAPGGSCRLIDISPLASRAPTT